MPPPPLPHHRHPGGGTRFCPVRTLRSPRCHILKRHLKRLPAEVTTMLGRHFLRVLSLFFFFSSESCEMFHHRTVTHAKGAWSRAHRGFVQEWVYAGTSGAGCLWNNYIMKAPYVYCSYYQTDCCNCVLANLHHPMIVMYSLASLSHPHIATWISSAERCEQWNNSTKSKFQNNDLH